MSDYRQGPDGRFRGSVGEGKTRVPTPSQTPAAPAAEQSTSEPDTAGMWAAYVRRRTEIDRAASVRDTDDQRDRFHTILDQADVDEDDVRAAWNFYVEHDTVGYRPADGVRDLGPRILTHPACPTDVLNEAAIGPLDADLDWAVRAASHPHADSAVLDAAAAATLEAGEDPRREPEMTAGVARPTVFSLPDMPADLLTDASTSRSSQVRLDVASNPATPHQVARTMAMREKDSYVIAALRRRFRRTGDEDSLTLLRGRASR